jgi:hypothetical protein
MELIEIRNKWKQRTHIMRMFADEEIGVKAERNRHIGNLEQQIISSPSPFLDNFLSNNSKEN